MDAPEMLSLDWWDGDDTMPATVGALTPKSRQQFAHRRVDYLRDDINAAATIEALRAEVEALRGAVSLMAKAERLRDHYHSLPNERLPIGSKPSVKGRARDAWMRAYRKAARRARDVLGPAF